MCGISRTGRAVVGMCMFIRDSRPTLTRKCALATYRKEVISCIPSLHCRPRGLALAWVNSSGSKPTGVSGRGCVHSVHDVLYVACSTPVGCTVCSNAVRIPHSATPCTQPCGPLPVLPSVYGRRCLSWPPSLKSKMNRSLPLPFSCSHLQATTRTRSPAYLRSSSRASQPVLSQMPASSRARPPFLGAPSKPSGHDKRAMLKGAAGNVRHRGSLALYVTAQQVQVLWGIRQPPPQQNLALSAPQGPSPLLC